MTPREREVRALARGIARSNKFTLEAVYRDFVGMPMTTEQRTPGLRRYVGWGAALLVALLVTGYITNDQFADLLGRLIPFGLIPT